VEIKPLVKDDYVLLDDEATISELIGKLKAFEKRTGLVFRKKKYLGLLEKKKLLKSKIDAKHVKVSKFLQKTPIINENADLIETAYLMYKSNLEYAPVECNKQITGVLNAIDLADSAMNLEELKKVKVEDIKLVKPSKVRKDESVSTAMSVMYKDKVDQVPLFDKGKIYGIISFKDLLRKYINWSPKRDNSAKFNKMANSSSAGKEAPKIDSLPVSNFSTNENLLTINPKENLKRAVSIMAKNRVSDLLVMDNEEYHGLLTTKNILRKIASLKIPQNFNIKFVGLNKTNLTAHQKYSLRKITSNEAFKLQRKIKNQLDLVLHIKEYDKDGTKRKFAVNLRLEFPGQIITSSQEDWDFETALRKTFDNAKNSVRKKFKGDTSWDKPYE
jgi:predicted transcriptional regulator